jgi:hypothetical protein
MIEVMIEWIKEFITYPPVILFGTMTIIEFVPIKINPWKWIFQWIGNAVNGEIRKDLAELKRDFEETKAQDKRWNILNFASSCRKGEEHSREEWKHAISEIREYEEYTKRKNITNGVIEEDSKYLRELYHERNMKNDFL